MGSQSPPILLLKKFCWHCLNPSEGNPEEKTRFFAASHCRAPITRTTCLGNSRGCLRLWCDYCNPWICLRWWIFVQHSELRGAQNLVQAAKLRDESPAQLMHLFDFAPTFIVSCYLAHGFESMARLTGNLMQDIADYSRYIREGGGYAADEPEQHQVPPLDTD